MQEPPPQHFFVKITAGKHTSENPLTPFIASLSFFSCAVFQSIAFMKSASSLQSQWKAVMSWSDGGEDPKPKKMPLFLLQTFSPIAANYVTRSSEKKKKKIYKCAMQVILPTFSCEVDEKQFYANKTISFPLWLQVFVGYLHFQSALLLLCKPSKKITLFQKKNSFNDDITADGALSELMNNTYDSLYLKRKHKSSSNGWTSGASGFQNKVFSLNRVFSLWITPPPVGPLMSVPTF